jgi:ABC-2 type transport system ATP-binding protein
VRREILAAIIRTIAEEGRTVLFSSHLLDEVERVSDHVALIDHGKIVLCDSLDTIKAAHRRLTLRFDEPLSRPPTFPGTSRWEGIGYEWSTVWRGSLDDLRGRVAGVGARIVEEQTPTLDEIFIASVRSQTQQPDSVEV